MRYGWRTPEGIAERKAHDADMAVRGDAAMAALVEALIADR